MKKLTVLLMAIVCYTITMAQAPNLLNFQGVARNSVGNVLASKSISVRLTVHDVTAAGASVYSETRAVTTNAFGLFNIVIGSAGATSTTGTVAGVNRRKIFTTGG
jgi:L,D-peptidoglycan transpeptidase YkuD (ErfK/YbiS/YcfS/YnhG family)